LLVNLYQAAVIYAFNNESNTQQTVSQLMDVTGLNLEDVSRHVHSFASPKVGQLLQIFVAGSSTEQQQGMKIPLDPSQIIKLNVSNFVPPSRKVRVPAVVPKSQQNLGGIITTASNMMMGAPTTSFVDGKDNNNSNGMSSQQATSVMMMGAGTTSFGGGAAAANSVDINNPQQQAILEKQRTPTVEATIMKVMKSRQKMEHQALMATVMDHLVQRFKPDPKFVKQCVESLLNREFIQRDPKDPNVYLFLTS
jgi:hypothetical protein